MKKGVSSLTCPFVKQSFTLQQNVAEGCLKGITLEISLYKRNNYITMFRLSLICCKGKYLLERGQIFFWVFCKFFSLCFFSYFFCRFLLSCGEFEVSLQPFCANESVCTTHYKKHVYFTLAVEENLQLLNI